MPHRLLRSVRLAFAAVLMSAPAAFGATASTSGGVLTYSLNNSADQTVTFSGSSSDKIVTLTDTTGVARAFGSDCSAISPNQVQCGNISSVVTDTGAGDDNVDASGLTGIPISVTDNARSTNGAQTFRGGTADDTITDLSTYQAGGYENVYGGPGNDTLTGAYTQYVRLHGDAGNDVLKTAVNGTNGGFVQFDGGVGIDRVDFGGSTQAVDVNLADQTARVVGQASQYLQPLGNNEAVSGTSGNDLLSGSSAANVLAGSGGDDALSGADGNDFLAGGAPDDATTQKDVLNGGNGSDTVTFSYLTAANGVNVTLDGAANDGDSSLPGGLGAPATGAANASNVRNDVERVNGTNQGDTLSAAALTGQVGVTLVGNGGIDTLTGSPFADFLDGGPETTNTLDCGAGSDSYRISSQGVPPQTNCENGI